MKFGDAEIKKIEFGYSKKTISIDNDNFEKILLSNKFAYSKNKKTNEKHFIKSKKVEKIRPLVAKPPKMSKYLNEFKQAKYMTF